MANVYDSKNFVMYFPFLQNGESQNV